MSQLVPVDALEILAREVAKILNVETVETDAGIGELGIDSLNIVELIVFCEQLYGAIDPEALNITQYTTLQQLDTQLRHQQHAA
jgi:acyl carrier protein